MRTCQHQSSALHCSRSRSVLRKKKSPDRGFSLCARLLRTNEEITVCVPVNRDENNMRRNAKCKNVVVHGVWVALERFFAALENLGVCAQDFFLFYERAEIDGKDVSHIVLWLMEPQFWACQGVPSN